MPGLPSDSREARGPRGEESDVDLRRRLLDPEFMLEVFRRELPALSDEPVRILSCDIKPAKTVRSRKAIRDRRSAFVYRLEIEGSSGVAREVVLLGQAPVTAGFPGPALEQRCQELRAHPEAPPFRRLALRLEALPLGLLCFPLDPALAALAEITGPGAARLVAPHLPECRAGAALASTTYELRHYKPGERAVLRMRVEFVPGPETPAPRHVYAKLFADEHGAVSYRELCALWTAARASHWLRVPEPLGYDAGRRMLLLAEVPGGRALADWVHCLEHSEALPPGVDLARLERCLGAAACALADLQRSGVRPAARRSFRDVLVSLAKDRELLRQGAHDAPPELVTRALALVRRLEAAAPGAEILVPSHGGARHKQTVGDEHGLTFVDWDGFCLANPALDPATFLARLRFEPITNPGQAPELEHLAESFRAEFLARSPAAGAELVLYEALVLSEQLLRSFRRGARAVVPDGAGARLAHAAEERLARHERGT
jgi:hypothetical protein